MNVTQKIREAYRRSTDRKDRAGVFPFSFEGWWFDRAAREHDQATIRYRAGVTDETPKEIDDNLKKNLAFDAGRHRGKRIVAYVAGAVAAAAGWFIWY